MKNAAYVNPDTLPWRPCVGIAIISETGRIFAGRRIDGREHGMAETWQMPQGGIDEGETPEAAALREMAEETGLFPPHVSLLGATRGWHCYDIPPALVPVLWGGRYRGQKQKWFAFRFSGKDANVNIHTGRAEFDRWQWMTPDALLAGVVPFKRGVYDAVFHEFSSFL